MILLIFISSKLISDIIDNIHIAYSRTHADLLNTGIFFIVFLHQVSGILI